ncbi:MAG TPA: triose-phosphate isomerase [bacterium]
MRIPFIAGNWKMYTTASETESLIVSLKTLLADSDTADVLVCPPFPYLMLASKLLGGSRIGLGAQNMFWEGEGAFTGEVSPLMLKDAGCTHVILGHSERRQHFSETDSWIHKKIKKAMDVGLKPIVCVGETLSERESRRTERAVETQLKGCFADMTHDRITAVTIAYEPVWAIGTGVTATPEQAQEMHLFIRRWLYKTFGNDVANLVRLQYGGSVKPDNAKALLSQPDIDGALVGGASLKADSFAAIVKAVA